MTVEEMKTVDIRTVSRDELVDIRDVVIDSHMMVCGRITCTTS